ncbi:hypothetical protein [Massilia sp.]|uniref:hypothetical protein n=1 Tax=Massilia sp. TaxID=1882437 RepID=UPI003918C3BA
MTIIMDLNLISILKGAYWCHSIATSGNDIMATIINFVRSLFLTPAPITAHHSGGDLWSLYQLSRGRDSVSPAVLRKLAEAAK